VVIQSNQYPLFFGGRKSDATDPGVGGYAGCSNCFVLAVPGFSTIGSNLKMPIIGTGPDDVLIIRTLGNGEDSAVIFRTGIVSRYTSAVL
jgi:hypothetical protein